MPLSTSSHKQARGFSSAHSVGSSEDNTKLLSACPEDTREDERAAEPAGKINAVSGFVDAETAPLLTLELAGVPVVEVSTGVILSGVTGLTGFTTGVTGPNGFTTGETVAEVIVIPLFTTEML
jgi:hypothetical protein